MAMIVQMLTRLSRVRITLGYAAVLIGVSAALVDLSPRARAHVVAQASTNLHNLAHGHLATLLDSAFITDAGPMYFWLPCLVCLLALAELIWQSGRLATVFVTGHIGTTLLVAIGLAAAIEFGWLPLSVSRASDVGVSYGALAVLGALTAAIPRRWRPAWIGWWLPLGIAGAALGALGSLLGALARDARSASLVAVLVVMPVVFLGLVPREVTPVAGWLSDALPLTHAVRYFASSLYDTSPWRTVGRELLWLVGLGAVFGGLARLATRRLLA